MLPANFFVVWKNLEEGYPEPVEPNKVCGDPCKPAA
jgi:hypothetical protein